MKAFIKTFKPKQNAQDFIDNIFKCCLFLDLTNIWPYQSSTLGHITCTPWDYPNVFIEVDACAFNPGNAARTSPANLINEMSVLFACKEPMFAWQALSTWTLL